MGDRLRESAYIATGGGTAAAMQAPGRLFEPRGSVARHDDGLLDAGDFDGASYPAGCVDYGPVIAFKNRQLARAWENFQAGRAPQLRAAFERFTADNKSWLDDYALFMALKDAHQGAAW